MIASDSLLLAMPKISIHSVTVLREALCLIVRQGIYPDGSLAA